MKYENQELLHIIFLLKSFKFLLPVRKAFHFIVKAIKPLNDVIFHTHRATLHTLKLVYNLSIGGVDDEWVEDDGTIAFLCMKVFMSLS